MSAQIVIDDGTNPAALGSTDNPVAFLGAAHTLSNFDDTGILGHRWTLVDRPIGSAAALSSTSLPTVTLTPDIEGTYLVRLQTYTDAAREVLEDADEQVVGVRFAEPFDWLIPAAGETTQQNARGWAEARERAIRDVHAFMNSGAPGLRGAVNEEITTLGSEVTLGGFVFNGGRVGTLSPSLEALGTLTVATTGVAEVRLYDLGAPGTPITPVLRSEVTFPNGTAGDVVRALQALTVATSPGVNADEVHDTARMYELRAIITGATGGDDLKILSAGLSFTS